MDLDLVQFKINIIYFSMEKKDTLEHAKVENCEQWMATTIH